MNRFLGIFILLISLSSYAHAAKVERERESGVVKPVVTILEKRATSEAGPIVEEFKFPKKYSSPYSLAIDSKDRVWVTEFVANVLAVFDPTTSELKEYRIPSTVGLEGSDWEYDNKNRTTPDKATNVFNVGSPGMVIVDKNDLVWFVLQLGNAIVRFDPEKEEFTEYPIPTPNSQPYDLAADSKGNIWYVEKNTGKIGFLNPEDERSFEITVYEGASLMGIAIDKDDKVWVSEVNSNILGRYDPETKKFKVFPISVPMSQPAMMRFDEAGMLWVCNPHAQQLGVLMTEAGIYSVVDIPGYNTVPQALVPAPNGRVWMVDSMTNKFGYFDSLTLEWTLFGIPTANAQPMSMDIDSKGDIWFTQSDRKANQIARILVKTLPVDQEPADDASQLANESTKKDDAGMLYIIGGAFLLLAVLVGFVVIRKSRS